MRRSWVVNGVDEEGLVSLKEEAEQMADVG